MRKLLALLLLLAAVAAALLFWAGRQAARLPAWYQEARQAGTLEPDLAAAAQHAEQDLIGRFGRELLDEVTADDGTPDESFLERIKRRGKIVLEGLREGREVRLDAHDLENLVLAWASQDERGRQLLPATRALRAEIGAGEVQLGAVVELDRLPENSLPQDQRRLLDGLARLGGSGGEIYVAVRAVPHAVDDRLLLGPPLRLVVGGLEMGTGLLKLLPVDASGIASGLPLDLGRTKVREARIAGEILVLIVSPDI